MDHLSLVVSASDRNKMSAQNLATALAPPLMLQSSDTLTPTTTSKNFDLDYQQPISVLKYLLQIWPTPKHHSGRRGRPPGLRGDSLSACPPGLQGQTREQSRHSAGLFPPPPRSAVSVPRGLQPQGPSLQILGPLSANKGPYRPLSPRVGPQAVAAALKPRQVIVSSPGSPSSSSDSQSGSDSVKHCLPSRVSSPAIRSSPSAQSAIMRNSPSVTLSSPGLRNSPSITSVNVNSPGPRNSPSISSLNRASPSILGGSTSRSSSPAMQASSAGLNVTLGTTTPNFSTLTGLQSTISNISTTANNLFGLSFTQPTTYVSTNPFLTGAYLNYMPGEVTNHGDKFNTLGSTKETKSLFDSYASETSKYSTLNSKSTYDQANSIYTSSDTKYNLGNKYQDKTGFLGMSSYTPELKFNSGRDTKSGNSYDSISPNLTQGSSSALLNIEDTPTPTSSIETEDSNTREVGEKDVEGDGEQSD